ncbi:hypothetical protein EHS39_25645 [Ensifer sp. MPMI2T]|nr:hypothetical protein EHS39_25645 [Ensifer sp. MPMI2T]
MGGTTFSVFFGHRGTIGYNRDVLQRRASFMARKGRCGTLNRCMSSDRFRYEGSCTRLSQLRLQSRFRGARQRT